MNLKKGKQNKEPSVNKSVKHVRPIKCDGWKMNPFWNAFPWNLGEEKDNEVLFIGQRFGTDLILPYVLIFFLGHILHLCAALPWNAILLYTLDEQRTGNLFWN